MQLLDPNDQAPVGQANYRPRYHFAAAEHWINDPNGLVYIEGTYHLFYQCNPFGTQWGNMSWGHAVSQDLVNWEERPVALPQREHGDRTEAIFSGCCVLDTENVSGLGAPGITPLLAFYTSHYSEAPLPLGRQAQSLAYSLDQGDSWEFYGDGPLLHLNHNDNHGYDADEFRDPKVFFHGPTGYWVMVLVLAKDRKIIFYRSQNLLDWTPTSTFADPGHNPDDLWEVPDLTEIPIEGTDQTRWAILLSVNTSGEHWHAGSTQHYFIGDFDGEQFHFDAEATAPVRDGHQSGRNRLDWGRDFYAAVTFHNTPGPLPITIAWMNNWAYANEIPHDGFRGQMTLAREIGLRQHGRRLQPTHFPLRPVQPHESLKEVVASHTLSQRETLQAPLPALTARLTIALQYYATGTAQLCLNYGSEVLRIVLDANAETVALDRTGLANRNVPECFAACDYAHDLALSNAKMVIYLDRSSIELFDANGEWSITQQIFPSSPLDSITVHHNQSETIELWIEALFV